MPSSLGEGGKIHLEVQNALDILNLSLSDIHATKIRIPQECYLACKTSPELTTDAKRRRVEKVLKKLR